MENFHTHTVRCGHASGSDREYFLAAIRAGITHLGFSDHAYLDIDACDGGTLAVREATVRDYLDSIRALREEYADRIRISVGFETEYYPAVFPQLRDWFRRAGVEYLLLGQHLCHDAEGKRCYAGRPTDRTETLDEYISLCLEGLETGAFTYLAHPDLIRYTGPREIYLERMARFVKRLKELGAVVEFNRLGFFEHRNYPDPDFWRLVAAEKLPVALGLDAHSPGVLEDRETIDRALAHLASLGITPVRVELRSL